MRRSGSKAARGPAWPAAAAALLAVAAACASPVEQVSPAPAVSEPAVQFPAAGSSRIAAGSLTPLDHYVRSEDPAYGYRTVKRIQEDGLVAHVLEMTSQTWLDPETVDRNTWTHWLTIIVPDAAQSDVALLYLTGGRNSDAAPDGISAERRRLALATGTVVAELRQVPNQYLKFADEQDRRRKEDEIIAYGWDRYLRTGDPLWLPRLPMTKAAVRAMDTVSDFCRRPAAGGIDIERFVVAGRSKRGWTTWTTAAVDDRVIAIVPMVIDILNMEASFAHHRRAYGFWAPAIDDYTEMDIPRWFGSEAMEKLTAIVEPFAYRQRLSLPKLLINASGDQFFLPDSSRFYFDDLPGEKHLRYVPNTGHSLEDTDATETLLAFYRSIVAGTSRPLLDWRIEADSISVRPLPPHQPQQVLLWQATNTEARDFRIDTLGRVWSSTALPPGDDGLYMASVPQPPRGWTAFFIELTYRAGGPEALKLTTGVHVVPGRLPFTWP